VFNVKRSTYPGGPYTTIASNVAGTTYTDSAGGGSYYYVVSGVTFGEGPNSNEVAPPVTAQPGSGLQTDENGAWTTFTIKYNVAAPGAGSLLQVVSNNTAEGVVSTSTPGAVPIANGFEINVPAGAQPSITVTVTGSPTTSSTGRRPTR
jgi:hypothetical protein